MTDNTGGGEDVKVQTVEELTEHVKNLNKGIAGYRDSVKKAEADALTAKSEAAVAKAEVERVKAEIEEAKKSKGDDKEVALSPTDQKKLEKWAKDNGFVTQKEMEAEKVRMFNDSIKNIETQAIEEFLKSFPQYNDDTEWNKIKEQFGLYKQPTSITAYRQLLNKIHKELTGGDDAVARARAQEQTRKRLAAGGGSQKGDEGGEAQITAMMEKYPNLSRDVIESRLEEINKLASDKAKRKAKK